MAVTVSTCAYVWGLLHRFWNKLMHILHGNTSFPSIAAFSDEARLGLALLDGSTYNSVGAAVDRDFHDEGRDSFHDCEEAPGSMGAGHGAVFDEQ